MTRTVTHIKQTSIGCPEQYEGELSNGKSFEVHLRWGVAEVKINGQSAILKNYSRIQPYKGIFFNDELILLLNQIDISLNKELLEEAKYNFSIWRK